MITFDCPSVGQRFTTGFARGNHRAMKYLGCVKLGALTEHAASDWLHLLGYAARGCYTPLNPIGNISSRKSLQSLSLFDCK